MRLLSKTMSESSIKRENEELLGINIRLRKFWQEITQKLNNVKDNYDPEKLKILKDYEKFCQEIMEKKSKLLQELKGIENEIGKKKEIYYGLIEKSDALMEKEFEIKEEFEKLNLRKGFVENLEQKWQEKQGVF